MSHDNAHDNTHDGVPENHHLFREESVPYLHSPTSATTPESPKSFPDKVADAVPTTAVSRTNSVIMGLSVLNVRKILQHMRAKWDNQVKNHEPFFPTDSIPMGLAGDRAWTAQEFALLFLQGHHAKRSQKRATQRARARPSMDTAATASSA